MSSCICSHHGTRVACPRPDSTTEMPASHTTNTKTTTVMVVPPTQPLKLATARGPGGDHRRPTTPPFNKGVAITPLKSRRHHGRAADTAGPFAVMTADHTVGGIPHEQGRGPTAGSELAECRHLTLWL